VSRRERRPADKPAVAIEHDGLKRDVNSDHDPRCRCPASAGDGIAEGDAGLCGLRKRVRRRVCRHDPCAQIFRAAGLHRQSSDCEVIDAGAFRMEVEQPCASFAILATPPAMVTRSTGCVRRYLSMPPTKSPISISAMSRNP
jgi:hypothetical protein